MGVGERGRMEGKVTLGFVGLGAMGSRMAKRLLDAGYPVVGYNRTPAKARWLVEAGLRLADSPRGAAEGSDVVFSMVTDTAALRAVALGPDGIVAGLGRGSTLVEMSTVSPAVILELAALAEARGAAAGLRALETIDGAAVTTYQPYWALRAHLLRALGRAGEAADATARAIGLSEDPAVRAFLADA